MNEDILDVISHKENWAPALPTGIDPAASQARTEMQDSTLNAITCTHEAASLPAADVTR